MDSAPLPLTPPISPSSPLQNFIGTQLERVSSFRLEDSMGYDDEDDEEEDLDGRGQAEVPEEEEYQPNLLASKDLAGNLKGLGGKGKLKVAIITENFLPKVDGVTRTLARLLEHLNKEGHEAILCGPDSGMSHYASHPLVGTLGVPLVVYPGLKLNFLRPKFMREIEEFNPDVIHFVDPIWLGGQAMMGIELGWAGEKWVGEKGPGVGGGVRGAVVASYHTNLATYATLFGLPFLTPVIWVWQRWLYSKCRLYLCPSDSTAAMLASHNLNDSRIWSRGVNLTDFNPKLRSEAMRASWGLKTEAQRSAESKSHGLATPPSSPQVLPLDSAGNAVERLAVLYVGRVSWEKNLMLLLNAYDHLSTLLPSHPMPKLVFVGDGPARVDLEAWCQKRGIDASFMGHRSGLDLAECYASADIFAFPSFTETFGQVVLEALASGLPVCGLDAEGTRDLVKHNETGKLLTLPSSSRDWPIALKSEKSATFMRASQDYAILLSQLIQKTPERIEMGERAARGTKGRTWHEAMEMCVDGYREAITMSETRAEQLRLAAYQASRPTTDDGSRPIRARVGRVLGRLRRGRRHMATAYPGQKMERERLFQLKNLAKVLVILYMIWIFYSRMHL